MTLFTQVVEGIAFLHSIGIAHRDIKPENLVVESYDPPRARIIDFGCATKEDCILYDRPGTIPYLAPEQRPGVYHGRAVDYWACGLVGLDLMKYKRSGLQVDSSMLARIHAWLDGRQQHPMAACCRGFLEWNVEDRLTAQTAIDGVLLEYVRTGSDARDPAVKSKRNGSPLRSER
jgi:serine/threonine protein kinase